MYPAFVRISFTLNITSIEKSKKVHATLFTWHTLLKLMLEITSKYLTMSSNGFGCFLVAKYSLVFNFNCFECIFSSFLSTVLTAEDDMMANDVSTLKFTGVTYRRIA